MRDPLRVHYNRPWIILFPGVQNILCRSIANKRQAELQLVQRIQRILVFVCPVQQFILDGKFVQRFFESHKPQLLSKSEGGFYVGRRTVCRKPGVNGLDENTFVPAVAIKCVCIDGHLFFPAILAILAVRRDDRLAVQANLLVRPALVVFHDFFLLPAF